jgi:hypothetical protein
MLAQRFVVGLLIASLVTLTPGCANMPPANGGDGAGNADGVAPEIPPDSTFLMDFGDFSDNTAGFKSGTVQQMFPGSNWRWAAGNVAIWNILVSVTLAVPVAAFIESFNHDPVFEGNGRWLWSYDVQAVGANYSAQLSANVSADGVTWEMLISREGDFTDIQWFTGMSDLDGMSGTWTLNRDPEVVEPFVLIEWNRDAAGAGDIRYTNIAEGDAGNGSSIYASNMEGAEWDATYEIFNLELENETLIEWNRATKAGRVQDQAQFGDADWHCWSEALQNSDCEDGDNGDGDNGDGSNAVDDMSSKT